MRPKHLFLPGVSGDSGGYSGYKTSIWDPLSDNAIGCNHRDYVIHIFFYFTLIITVKY